MAHGTPEPLPAGHMGPKRPEPWSSVPNLYSQEKLMSYRCTGSKAPTRITPGAKRSGLHAGLVRSAAVQSRGSVGRRTVARPTTGRLARSPQGQIMCQDCMKELRTSNRKKQRLEGLRPKPCPEAEWAATALVARMRGSCPDRINMPRLKAAQDIAQKGPSKFEPRKI